MMNTVMKKQSEVFHVDEYNCCLPLEASDRSLSPFLYNIVHMMCSNEN